MNLFYLIGEPGAGKTTLFAELTRGLAPIRVDRPFAHVLWPRTAGFIAELGPRRKGGFAGTDGLSMSAQPTVIDWLRMWPYEYIFGEGDRLANEKFFQATRAQGYELTVAYLACPPDILEDRRATRVTTLHAKPQDATWLAGRRTKVHRLAESYATIVLDATLPPTELAARLRFHPVFAELGGNGAT